VLTRDKTYRYGATVEIPSDYPQSPPVFKLKDLRQHEEVMMRLSEDFLSKMEKSDIRAVESLRPKD
jgi:hypothetical protein